MLMSIPQCTILEIPVNDSINDFDRVFPVKDCIVGMLLKFPIKKIKKFILTLLNIYISTSHWGKEPNFRNQANKFDVW